MEFMLMLVAGQLIDMVFMPMLAAGKMRMRLISMATHTVRVYIKVQMQN
jgi:hypothetical protein